MYWFRALTVWCLKWFTRSVEVIPINLSIGYAVLPDCLPANYFFTVMCLLHICMLSNGIVYNYVSAMNSVRARLRWWHIFWGFCIFFFFSVSGSYYDKQNAQRMQAWFSKYLIFSKHFSKRCFNISWWQSVDSLDEVDIEKSLESAIS